VRLPAALAADGTGEPLLVSGVTGAGDFLAVFAQADGRVCFGVDHWGRANPPMSEPLSLAAGQAVDIVVSAGFLWPPGDAPLYAEKPEARAWRRRLVLAVNGRVVLDTEADTHAAMPGTQTVGVNFIGGSTTRANFRGVVEEVRPVGLAELEAMLSR
jgi:hypothetical protein